MSEDTPLYGTAAELREDPEMMTRATHGAVVESIASLKLALNFMRPAIACFDNGDERHHDIEQADVVHRAAAGTR
jgi:hypothetical protein